MSDLTNFRNHCRSMAKAARTGGTAKAFASAQQGIVAMRVAPDDAELWDRLAGEVDVYLAGELGEVAAPPGDDMPFDLDALLTPTPPQSPAPAETEETK